jgi:hypothetical protein
MLQQWLEWHHLIFLLPLVAAVLMVLLAGLSDLHFGHAEVGSLEGADLHGDVHGEAGLHTDGHLDHDACMDADAHADSHGHAASANGHHEGLMGVLELFGVGHLPLSLVLQTLAILWGVIGLLLIQIVPPGVAIPITTIATLVGARSVAVALGRLLGGSEAARRSQFVGKMGEVVLEVTPRFGVVHVRDERGTLYRLNARVEAEALAPGQKIVVVGYDPQEHLYEVADPVRYLETGGK